MHLLLLLVFAGIMAAPVPAIAQEQDIFENRVFRATVLEIRTEGERPVPGTMVIDQYQELSVRIDEGSREGAIIETENTTPVRFKEGDALFMLRSVADDGSERWAVGEPNRQGTLVALTVIFALVTVIAGGRAGVRSLVALGGSLAIILLGLVPALSAGWEPVSTSIGFAAAILVLSMFATHGWNRPTLVALAGSAAALALAVVVAEWSVRAAKLTGFVSDEAIFLNLTTSGSLNLPALLLGSILIGVVGVLNDISVSQAHTVAELHEANPSLSRQTLFTRAMKVGREHLGAVVNTLPLAYAGASLPLLLIFSASDAPLIYIANREVFAAEIIRVLAGGIALSLSGAIATILAVLLTPVTRRQESRPDILQRKQH